MGSKAASAKISDEEIHNAFAEARRVTNKEGAIEPRAKGLSFYNTSDRPPFKGMSQEQSDAFRKVLGSRYAGLTHLEACEVAGVDPGTLSNATKRYPEAWMQCHAEIREAVAREHFINLGFIRTALSEYAPHAIRTLYAIMVDKRNSPSIRKQCANDILKMCNVDNSAGVSQAVDEAAGAISEALNQRLKGEFGSGVIIDADYYEEEGEDDE